MNLRSFLTLILLLVLSSCSKERAKLADKEESPSKIISLAPSITEILCALDLQEKIVGVTDFCKDPYKKTNFKELSVGGLINPNFEKILKSKADIVFTLKGKADHAAKLEKFGMKVITLDHIDLDGVFKSIDVLGKACAVEEKANALHKKLSAEITQKDNTKGPEVLITISRLSIQSNIQLWVAGNDGFYSRLLGICAAKNAIRDKARFSQISLEAMMKMNPDYIILLIDKLSENEQQEEKKAWQKLSNLKAVKNNKFYIITGDEVMIPGPRFPVLLKKLKAVLGND